MNAASSPSPRVSDADRRATAERLRVALAEGRLHLMEYDERMAHIYASVTSDDVLSVLRDLPEPTEVGHHHRVPSGMATGALRPLAQRLPRWMLVLWALLSAIFAVDMITWTLVSISSGSAVYFWPMWLLVPGLLLCGASHVLMRRRPTALEGGR